jgi:DNA-binding MurR/RpiR family transcriptional regulator
MSYEERIREARAGLSKSFSRLADFILDSYVQAALMTATELAHQVDVDAATVVRFAQRLGYSGFPELQDEIKERVKSDLLIHPPETAAPDSLPGVINATMSRLGDALEQARMLLDTEAVGKLVVLMGGARRIVIAPEGLGQAAAYNLTNLLEQGGFLVAVSQPGATDLARAVTTALPEDLILALDVAGDSVLARAMAEARSRGIPTAAIVGAASHESANHAEVVLAAQNSPALGIGLVVVDALVYMLAEALRWQYAERFNDSDAEIEALFARIQTGD